MVSAAGASIKSLTEPLDTSGPIGNFIVQVLGAVAQLERSIIRERTVAGQVAAIKRGQVFGRPKVLSDDQEKEAFALVQSGLSKSEVSRRFKVSLIVIRRICDEHAGTFQTRRYPVLGQYLS